MENKLTLGTLFFCLGIILGHYIPISVEAVFFSLVICFICCLVSFKLEKFTNLFLLCLIVLLGAFHYKNSTYLPKIHISNFLYYKDETKYVISGYIKSEPRYKDNGLEFIFSVSELEFDYKKQNCSGDILVKVMQANGLLYGEELVLVGHIQLPTKFYPENISGIMRINNPQCVIRRNRNKGFFIKRFAFLLKARAERLIYGRLSPPAAAVLDAMVLGEKNNIPKFIYASMIKSGTVHILVVSGFNVGVVIFIIMLLLKLLHLSRTLRYLLTIICLIIYCFVTGASAPVLRATIMGGFLLVGFLIKREAQVYNSISLAALVILFINPKELFSISFQLSFVSVLAIVILYPAIKVLIHLDSINLNFIKLVIEGCCVSLSAWLGTFGLILYYFKIFSPVTVLANIAIVPLATLITLSGFSFLLSCLIFPPLTVYFAHSIELLVLILLKVNNFFIQLPFAYLYL